MDVDEKTLEALRLAAKFILDRADDIDYDTQFAARHLRAEHPSATPAAARATQENADQLRKDLAAVLDALTNVGIDS